MPDLKNLNDVFLRATESDNPHVISWRDKTGSWHPIASRDLYRRVRAVAASLESYGISKGDRVGIIAENRWEWPVVDFATLALGAVDVPIYPTLNAEQSAYMLRDSGARILFVSTSAQYDKIAAVRHSTMLEHIVLMDEESVDGALHFDQFLKTPTNESGDAAFNARLHEAQPGDLATIIYTSGTTGNSKGVELTHGNIASNIPPATAPFEWGKGEICISFLPLSHITARMLDYSLISFGATVAYCPSFDLVSHAIQEVKPTIFVSVPRVYEKIRQAVEQRATKTRLKGRMYHWAMKTGETHRAEILAGKRPSSLAWKIANKLVLSKIQGAFGGRLNHAISGGAPLGMETATWFANAGIRILEGYGLTETSPVIALNTPNAYRIGSVGKPLTNLQCRVAEDGELLVKGPSVFSRYWNNPDATREAFTEDGFFRTGDIGRIDEDGFLYITDRKKELLKTSGGKLIAPQPIEGKLKANLLVGHAALDAWAKQQGIETTQRQYLVRDQRVLAEYQRIVDRVNSTLSNFETMKRIHVVAEEWSLEGGELTPSLKLKRRIITERYAGAIDHFYSHDGASTHDAV